MLGCGGRGNRHPEPGDFLLRVPATGNAGAIRRQQRQSQQKGREHENYNQFQKGVWKGRGFSRAVGTRVNWSFSP
jgi:hypothetical protein